MILCIIKYTFYKIHIYVHIFYQHNNTYPKNNDYVIYYLHN